MSDTEVPPAGPPPRVALVVDGAVGAGRTVGIRLADAGTAVAVTVAGHGTGRAALLAKEFADRGLTALPYRMDPDAPNALGRVVAAVMRDLGPVELLVWAPRPALLPLLDGHAVDLLGRSGRPARVVAVTATPAALPPGSGPVQVAWVAPAEDEHAVAEAVLAAALGPVP
ncbi:hypothetical protein RVR_2117 [Actinacidiphila reveromycinica]|uniref:Uncharacterized protein n=1 Tax=Actinacidiphila reveromycinica TaxID=659352 RepID=A0A7U3UQ76_9ACTN|nr:hypothetical protein [Streptomyces sp. SN-593]BBA96700.1 hypothetical protein RVR_2117 [Streptomyces sp. SN-593]